MPIVLEIPSVKIAQGMQLSCTKPEFFYGKFNENKCFFLLKPSLSIKLLIKLLFEMINLSY